MAKMTTRTSSKPRARKRKRITCPQINDYLRLVETGKVRSCERQKKFCAYVRRVFAEEALIIDTEAIENYSKMLKFFPFDMLFPWEWCIFTLFMCVFRADGTPRWTDLVAFLGRGGGKNGFIAFVSFCAMTRTHGVQNYDIDICANSEDQARRSFDDVWAILEAKATKFKKTHRWSKTYITCKSTNSTMKYRTDNPKSKDGMRSGLIIFDEVHAYQNWKNITVFTTGQGKCANPRRAFISSNGDVRDGVFDTILAKCDRILDGEIDDNGYLPFCCMLDSEDEVHDERNWEKANPSLPYLPILMAQIRKEYRDWIDNPVENADFMTKRMGIPQGDREHEVTSWDNLLAASVDFDRSALRGKPCVVGIDFARTTDFVSAVLLFRLQNDEWRVVHHSWFCTHSLDKSRIRAPIEEWARMGIVTIVDDVEIDPALVTDWIQRMQRLYDVRKVAIDDFRFSFLKSHLERIGFVASEGDVQKVRPSDHMKIHHLVNSAFINRRIQWGEDPAMRWFANNAKLVPWQNGNFKYDKIEPKSRKTDGFMALAAAFCVQDAIPEETEVTFMAPLVF